MTNNLQEEEVEKEKAVTSVEDKEDEITEAIFDSMNQELDNMTREDNKPIPSSTTTIPLIHHPSLIKVYWGLSRM